MVERVYQNVYATRDGKYQLQFREEAWEKLNRLCDITKNEETGGILIGFYSENNKRAVIADVSEPPNDSKAGRNYFQRGIAGLTKLLKNLWSSKTRLHYVGEWHYHPADRIYPSSADFAQMREIAVSAQYQCREPIMVILGKVLKGVRGVRSFVCPAGESAKEMHKLV